ncbi:hypothetical protein [Catellatospora sichuanensis]|uniref:hypothetical protein n=1 Tax=Catellatospora sichuanensis TaxID=1969805 RepID=UPI001181EBB5|nr:hypothetical protein [Catellatospora sichuanensis]
MSAVVVALFVVVWSAPPGEPSVPLSMEPRCSDTSPCLPSPLLPIALGALLTMLFVNWLSPWTGALAGTVFVGGTVADTVVSDLPPPDSDDIAVMVVFLAAVWLLAGLAERQRGGSVDLVRNRTGAVPAPSGPRATDGRFRTWCLVGAAALVGIGIWQQIAAEIRQAKAEVVAAVVQFWPRHL